MMLRQSSGDNIDLCSVCQDPDELVGPGAPLTDIRLACYCPFHLPCIVLYLQSELGDKQQIQHAGGIFCPNAKESVNTCIYRGKYFSIISISCILFNIT